MTPIPFWAPPLLAVQFLTRVPVPPLDRLTSAAVRQGLVRSVGWFPLVGALVGLVTALVLLGSARLWPLPVAVLLALIIEARLTGAFHEDAVADTCDGLGGGSTPEDVRRILKDSRIGSYGALGLGLAVGLRVALLLALPWQERPLLAVAATVASACFGRLLVVALMAALAPAPAGESLAKDIGSGIGSGTLGLGVATAVPGLAPWAFGQPVAMAAAMGAAGLFLWWFTRYLLRRIGGSTGDCLGFAAYCGQLLLLLAATALP
jgi:adenosylcobinamide-GDP ribazoletransferase